jgi:hypothetical protein
MSFSATTISEHYMNEGRIEGETMGEFRGEFRGIIMGKIEMMEELYRFSVLSKEQMEKIIEPLKAQLQDLLSRVQ